MVERISAHSKLHFKNSLLGLGWIESKVTRVYCWVGLGDPEDFVFGSNDKKNPRGERNRESGEMLRNPSDVCGTSFLRPFNAMLKDNK